MSNDKRPNDQNAASVGGPVGGENSLGRVIFKVPTLDKPNELGYNVRSYKTNAQVIVLTSKGTDK